MKIFYSPLCLGYIELASPELPGRVREIVRHLSSGKYELIESQPATEIDLLRVHTPRLIEQVKTTDNFDIEQLGAGNIYNFAVLAAGSAQQAAASTLKDGQFSFSLMRPPGHHAGRDFNGGFCYFNNLAVAVSSLFPKIKRLAILDLDCHHGNGTQDIFLGHKQVIYVSLHQSPLYPGTGLTSEANCFNYPLPAKTEETAYLKALALALRNIFAFKPQILGLSVGFDTYKRDPLTDINLEIESYQKIAQAIKELKIPTFALLEGGYNQKELPLCFESFVAGFK
jgi:acetoin utilization deacetylase AcuC-like enzyme